VSLKKFTKYERSVLLGKFLFKGKNKIRDVDYKKQTINFAALKEISDCKLD
jgi:hypothetical protein